MENHKIGLIGLTAIGVGTMIGSGWLFSSYYAAKFAGPAAYFAWIITAIVILILGLCLAEISFNYPKRGLMARLLVISHNKDFAFVCTISTWLGLTAVIATEAEGSIQYLSSLSPNLSYYLFNSVSHQLTYIGIALSITIILVFGIMNFWGAKLLSHSNIILTFIKIIVPLLTAVIIIYSSFNLNNFNSTKSSIVPYGGTSIFIAMIGAGMVYSFNGFQNIASFVSEAKNPQRDIPLAMILSVTITLFVYLTLQTAFIGAIPSNLLQNGWSSLNFTSPFVQLTMILNLNFMTIILYADAIISPSGTGLIYTGSTTRMLTGMTENKLVPSFFNKLTKYNFSRRSLLTTVGLAMLFLLLFRSWSSLVSFLSLFYVISYMSIPLCLGKLRANNIKGSFSIPFVDFILPIIFTFLSILFICSKFPYTEYVTFFITSSFITYLITQKAFKSIKALTNTLRRASPVLAHIWILTILSWLGPDTYGGIDILNKIELLIGLIVISLLTYWFMVFKYKSSSN